MASCPKCGKPKIRKARSGYRRCPRCGVLPGVPQWGRSGEQNPPEPDEKSK